MSYRPAIFERMGAEFSRALGNVDCEFIIAGVAQTSVRGILRQWRDIDLSEELSQSVEGTTHLLSVASSSTPGLVSQRDKVTIFKLDPIGNRVDDGQLFEIRNHADDGRAMLKIYLKGDI